MDIKEQLKEYLLGQGASDVGFAELPDEGLGECRFAVSVAVRLSQAIIEEIDGEPTHTYFSHYRAVNAHIDRLLLLCGLFLQKHGYKYITVAASQSINKNGWNYSGRYSHKKAARLSGMGSIGKNSMFIHRDFGSAVRLGTVLTDMPLTAERELCEPPCGECTACVGACPAGAITGEMWSENAPRESIFNPEKCSEHMKKAYKHIGRGAVCGICIKVCPHRFKG